MNKRKPPERGDIKDDSMFVQPHVYRVPKRLNQGPIVAAAMAALEARGWAAQ